MKIRMIWKFEWYFFPPGHEGFKFDFFKQESARKEFRKTIYPRSSLRNNLSKNPATNNERLYEKQQNIGVYTLEKKYSDT